MSNNFVIGDTFVNYALIKDINGAYQAKVFSNMGDLSENEERHVSELERRMAALDEKETYIAIRTLVEHHVDTVKKSLEYLNKQKEGEKKCHT